ncbi:hypothetical protein D3C75_944630 [compost metagenome]
MAEQIHTEAHRQVNIAIPIDIRNARSFGLINNDLIDDILPVGAITCHIAIIGHHFTECLCMKL